jgi:hypothetical protein
VTISFLAAHSSTQKMEQHLPPKLWYLSTKLYDITSQKAVIFKHSPVSSKPVPLQFCFLVILLNAFILL